jgi:hypothetical protein
VNAANHSGGTVMLVEAVESAAGNNVLIEKTNQEVTISAAAVDYLADF